MGLNRIWIIVIFALAVGGCSRFKLLYSFSGEAIKSEVGYFLNLNEDEQTALEAKFVDLFDWHRVQMLPRYADFLRRTAEEVDAGPLEEATVRQAVRDLRQLLRVTMQGASPFIADVLVHHTNPKKLDHLRSRMAERNAERRRALEEPLDVRIESKMESAISRFERFFGELTPQQTASVLRYFEEREKSSAAWLNFREERGRVLLAYLSDRPGRDEIAQFMPVIMLRSAQVIDPAYKRYSDDWWASFTDWMVKILVSLTPVQRRTFSEVLRNYETDMIELSS